MSRLSPSNQASRRAKVFERSLNRLQPTATRPLPLILQLNHGAYQWWCVAIAKSGANLHVLCGSRCCRLWSFGVRINKLVSISLNVLAGGCCGVVPIYLGAARVWIGVVVWSIVAAVVWLRRIVWLVAWVGWNNASLDWVSTVVRAVSWRVLVTGRIWVRVVAWSVTNCSTNSGASECNSNGCEHQDDCLFGIVFGDLFKIGAVYQLVCSLNKVPSCKWEARASLWIVLTIDLFILICVEVRSLCVLSN